MEKFDKVPDIISKETVPQSQLPSSIKNKYNSLIKEKIDDFPAENIDDIEDMSPFIEELVEDADDALRILDDEIEHDYVEDVKDCVKKLKDIIEDEYFPDTEKQRLADDFLDTVRSLPQKSSARGKEAYELLFGTYPAELEETPAKLEEDYDRYMRQ